jgi:hypothetical protein
MRTKGRFGSLRIAQLSLFLIASTAFTALSQTNSPLIPVVTIRATDPLASWSGDTGTFTLFRAGPTDATLNVYYRIEGTASNGVDYSSVGNFTLIPAGARSSSITISPINHGQTDTKTVVLQLAPSPMLTPVNYSIGSPSNATVYIAPNGSNIPPLVNILSPTNGEVVNSPAFISLFARASDPDGSISNVEFFDGSNDLGHGLQVIIDPPGVNGNTGLAYFLRWSNPPAGPYVLTAVATDNGGASTRSDQVKITVLPNPPPTNLPPVVRIIGPANGSIFHAPVDIPIYTYAHDPDDAVATVEVFAGTNSLGFGNALICPSNPPCASCPVRPCPTNTYLLVWSNAPLGIFALTAKATDTRGASSISDPVKVTILPSLPPPTNRPPIINIVATDPIAIEGTNCWPWIGPTNTASTSPWSNWAAGMAVCRYFTNCGPRNATFTVHRFGVTNDPVVVNYAIGGTATNGSDYVTLPGSVTIPAGERSALIAVVPIDDGPPDITSTVILKLKPDNSYLIGAPAQAAAIILDGPFPRPITGLLPDRCFHVNAAGPDGAWFHIESTTDLLKWTSICTNQVIQGSIDFVDPDAQSAQLRFYRAVPENSPPPE